MKVKNILRSTSKSAVLYENRKLIEEIMKKANKLIYGLSGLLFLLVYYRGQRRSTWLLLYGPLPIHTARMAGHDVRDDADKAC